MLSLQLCCIEKSPYHLFAAFFYAAKLQRQHNLISPKQVVWALLSEMHPGCKAQGEKAWTSISQTVRRQPLGCGRGLCIASSPPVPYGGMGNEMVRRRGTMHLYACCTPQRFFFGADAMHNLFYTPEVYLSFLCRLAWLTFVTEGLRRCTT